MKKEWNDKASSGWNCCKKKLLCMKLTLLIVCCFFMQSFTVLSAQSITLRMENASLEEVLWELKEITELTFLYSDEDVREVKGIDLNVVDWEIDAVLKQCLTGTGLEYVRNGDAIIIKRVERTSQTQYLEKKVSGKVTDSKGNPLPGVTVFVKGTVVGTSTNNKGEYTIPLGEIKDASLVFSFIGMKSQEIIVGTKTVIDVKMLETTSDLDEVVVTGYQDIRKDRMTGSVTVITAKEIENNSFKSIDQILEGKVAGLYSYKTTGAPGARSNIRIRGDNSISGNKEPLCVRIYI